MTINIHIDIPTGDPAAVGTAVRHLNAVAQGLSDTGKRLGVANRQANQAWEGKAQQVFTILAGGFGDIIGGTGAVTSRMAAALAGYSNTLHQAQTQAHRARQQLNALIAATPPGTIPDPGTVAQIRNQATQAQETAKTAAHQLASAAGSELGIREGTPQLPGGDPNASFVSRAHAVSDHAIAESARRHNAQHTQISQQLGRVLTGLYDTANRRVFNHQGSAATPQGGIAVNPNQFQVIDPASGRVVVDFGPNVLDGDRGPGFSVYDSSGHQLDPDNLSLEGLTGQPFILADNAPRIVAVDPITGRQFDNPSVDGITLRDGTVLRPFRPESVLGLSPAGYQALQPFFDEYRLHQERMFRPWALGPGWHLVPRYY